MNKAPVLLERLNKLDQQEVWNAMYAALEEKIYALDDKILLAQENLWDAMNGIQARLYVLEENQTLQIRLRKVRKLLRKKNNVR